MRHLTAASCLVLLFVSALARADQCELVDADVGQRAATAIAGSHARVLSYCAPCGDPLPAIGAAHTPHDVRYVAGSVVIDGASVDLAYTYLEVAPNVFENVALRTGCSAFDVPEVLRFRGATFERARFAAPPPALRRFGWGRPPSQAPRLPAPG